MRFIRLCLILITCNAVGLAVIRWLGTTQPDSIAILFTNPDGSPCKMPCLFGVRTGEMTVGEALAVLRTHPLTKNMQRRPLQDADAKYGAVLRTEGAMIVIAVPKPETSDDVPVSVISLIPDSRQDPFGLLSKSDPRLTAVLAGMTSGAVFLYFGPPDEVEFSSDPFGFPHGLDLIYHERGLVADNRLKPEIPSGRYLMDINGSLDGLIVVTTVQGRHFDSYPWLGFVSIEDYGRRSCKIRRLTWC
jgi:hypothetical protein